MISIGAIEAAVAVIAVVVTILGTTWRLGALIGQVNSQLASIDRSLIAGAGRMDEHATKLDEHSQRLAIVETKIGMKGTPCVG